MTNQIEKKIRSELGERFQLENDSLSFLKYNTPISGTGVGTKALFFVFKSNARDPLFVVKTIRNARDQDVINSGFSRLRTLQGMVKGKEYSSLFPEPLLLHGEGVETWSVETYMRGERVSLSIKESQILEQYTAFSKFISKQSKNTITVDIQYVHNLIDVLEGNKEQKEELISYAKTLFGDAQVVLPEISQHGDFTIDNILFMGDAMRVVDCDIFGTIGLPGYDIFHLLSRGKDQKHLQDVLAKYFHELGISVQIHTRLLFAYYLHELVIKKDYILKTNSSRTIIEKFEEMVVSRL